MHFRKAAIAVTGLAVALGLAGAVWVWSLQNRIYSSPIAWRTNAAHLRAHGPAAKRIATPQEFFDGIRVSSTANEIEILVPEREHPHPEMDFEPLLQHQANHNQSVQIGNGTVRLGFIGVATEPPTKPHGSEVPLRLFTAGLAPATKEQTAGLLPAFEQKAWVHGDVPVARFHFVLSNTPPLKPHRMEVFDGRTRWPLSASGSMAQLEHLPSVWFEKQLSLWHQTPLDLVVTMIGGSERRYSLAPKAGEEVRFDGCHVRVLAMAEGANSSFSSSGDGRTNRVTIALDTGLAWDKKPRSTFVLHADFPGEIEFYGANDKKLATGGMNSSAGLSAHNVIARLDDVKEIRVRYLPETHRMFFKLPELPGLPEENRGLENLFDVRVPALHFRYEHAFQQKIGQLAQMDMINLPLTFPNGFFPTTRTNTTPRELFIEMAGLLSNPEDHLVADPSRNVIEARKHPLRALLNEVKRRVGL